MKFNENPYYSPEKCGLEIFDQIDTGECYEFDMLVIWIKQDDKTLWYDYDSGCSCPCPFDNDDNGHDLKQITDDTYHNFYDALKSHYSIDKNDIYNISNKVKEYLKLNN